MIKVRVVRPRDERDGCSLAHCAHTQSVKEERQKSVDGFGFARMTNSPHRLQMKHTE
jgi:hypothetical protein